MDKRALSFLSDGSTSRHHVHLDEIAHPPPEAVPDRVVLLGGAVHPGAENPGEILRRVAGLVAALPLVVRVDDLRAGGEDDRRDLLGVARAVPLGPRISRKDSCSPVAVPRQEEKANRDPVQSLKVYSFNVPQCRRRMDWHCGESKCRLATFIAVRG